MKKLSERKVLLASIRKRIAILDSRNREHVVSSRLKSVSEENVKHLRQMFGLPEVRIVEENVLANMRGMLEDYAEEGVDSVELLRRAREE